MNIIESSFHHFRFDRDTKPVLSVKPGEIVTFHTLDACCGQVRTAEQFLHWRASKRRSGPLTGPVFVDRAAPGDTLVVDILDVKLDATGFQLIGPHRAIIEDEIPQWTCYEVRVEGMWMALPNGVRLPVDPVIGTFGNAPASEPTSLASRTGGNYDVPVAKIGSKLYIPIEVNGAIFSLGDVHACQGDGEVVGAPEIGAEVTVRLNLLGHRHSQWCMIEDAIHWHTPCSGENEYQAARRSVFQNAEFISTAYNIKLKDAMILLTMAGKLAISRTGSWGDHKPVVCSSFPKDVISKAVADYHNAGPKPSLAT